MAETVNPKLLHVRVVPNAPRSCVVGWDKAPDDLPGVEKILRVRLAAPPVDGKANNELLRLLADAGGVPRRELQLRAGASGRLKTVAVPTAWMPRDIPDLA